MEGIFRKVDEVIYSVVELSEYQLVVSYVIRCTFHFLIAFTTARFEDIDMTVRIAAVDSTPHFFDHQPMLIDDITGMYIFSIRL